MIRYVALILFLAVSGCSPTISFQKDEPSASELAKCEGWARDLRERELRQLAGQGRGGAGVTEIALRDGDVVPLFSGPAPMAADGNAPVFNVCHTVGGVVGVEVWTWAEGATVGPEHPSIQKVTVAPGNCVFASGPLIEVRGNGFSSEESRVASEWIEQRIASLEAEPQSAPRDELLADFRMRTRNHPASKVSFGLVSP